MNADLDQARVVSNLFGASGDLDALAAHLVAKRVQSNAAAVARWREWLTEHLDETLMLDDGALKQRTAWLFPIGGRSSRDPSAPAIGRHAMRAAVSGDPLLAEALRRSFDRALRAFGMHKVDGRVAWLVGSVQWSPRDDRRVSRMLHCMHSAGLAREAGVLFAFLAREFAGCEHAERLSWWRHQVLS